MYNLYISMSKYGFISPKRYHNKNYEYRHPHSLETIGFISKKVYDVMVINKKFKDQANEAILSFAKADYGLIHKIKNSVLGEYKTDFGNVIVRKFVFRDGNFLEYNNIIYFECERIEISFHYWYLNCHYLRMNGTAKRVDLSKCIFEAMENKSFEKDFTAAVKEINENGKIWIIHKTHYGEIIIRKRYNNRRKYLAFFLFELPYAFESYKRGIKIKYNHFVKNEEIRQLVNKGCHYEIAVEKVKKMKITPKEIDFSYFLPGFIK